MPSCLVDVPVSMLIVRSPFIYSIGNYIVL